MKKYLSFLLPLFIVFTFISYSYAYDPKELSDIKKNLAQFEKEINASEKLFLAKEISSDKIDKNIENLKVINGKAQEYIDIVTPIYDLAKSNLADLLPKGDTENKEAQVSSNIQTQQNKLREKLLNIEGILTHAKAIKNRSFRLINQFASSKRNILLFETISQNPLIYDKDLWEETYAEFSHLPDLIRVFNLSKNSSSYYYYLLALLSITIVACNILGNRYYFKTSIAEENFDEKKFEVVSKAILVCLFPFIIYSIFFYNFLSITGVVNDLNHNLYSKIFIFANFYFFLYFTLKFCRKAGYLRIHAVLLGNFIAILYFTDDTILTLLESNIEKFSWLAVSKKYFTTHIFSTLLILFSCIFYFRKTSNPFLSNKAISYITFSLGFLIIILNSQGYVVLSRYIFERIVFVIAIGVVFLVLRSFIRGLLFKIDQVINKSPEEDQAESEHLLLFWLNFTFDLLLIFLSLPILAWILGAGWEEIEIWIKNAFFGFQIGEINISISKILIAVAKFLIIIFAFRATINFLDRNILPKTKLAPSVRVSFSQILGYIGLAIAIITAISSLGFNLTNLALIAGALSVGIGFGLQSIVNNFVSGLIILFERPIKIGDWVIVTSGEGIVKKISIRATEIETFDRTSIIVPNSEFITASIKNWTHKDRIGRVIITVGVSYNANPHKVREILVNVAENNPKVLETPSPNVFFKDYGDSALIFELRVFIRNIREIYRTSTEIRLEIWDQFKKKGVEIPFPQRDLHLKTPIQVTEVKGIKA